MKQARCVVALVVLMPFAGIEASAANQVVPRDDLAACVARHFGDPDQLDETVGRSLVVRMIGDQDAEWQVSLKEVNTEKTVVEVVSALNGSVLDQLEKLRKRFPRLSTESLCEHVEVCRASITSGERARVARKLLDEIASARYPLVSSTPLYLHGRVYEVWATAYPNSGHFWLSAPSTEPSEDPIAAYVFRVVDEYGSLCQENRADGASLKVPNFKEQPAGPGGAAEAVVPVGHLPS